MTTLLYTILATTLVSSGSFIGILTLSLNHGLIGKILLPLVSLSAGTMLSAAFLHLLPESLETLGEILPFRLALISFIGFFLLERVLHWRHCHDEKHLGKHTHGTMNLIGDSIHNFLDGVLIAAAFASSPALGVATTLAIALHEIPQELGDFGVLLHSGYSRRRALILNVAVSLTSVIGGIIGYFATQSATSLASYLVPVAAGGFIYIAAADLIPELGKEQELKRIVLLVLTFLLGVLMLALFE